MRLRSYNGYRPGDKVVYFNGSSLCHGTILTINRGTWPRRRIEFSIYGKRITISSKHALDLHVVGAHAVTARVPELPWSMK